MTQAVLIKFPATTFFILTFILSWSGIIIVSFFTGMPAPSKTFASIAPVAMLPLVVGPTIISMVLTGLLTGKGGIKAMLSRIIRWKQRIPLYLFALLTFPLIAVIVLAVLSRFSPVYLPQIITSPDKINTLIMGLSVGIILTLFEEIGWSGFATPELRKRFSILTSGLIIGAIWGLWHFLPVFYGCGDETGKFNFQLFYPGLFFHYAGLIPFRILMVWVYDKSGSILLPWIMHATLTSCAFFILNISVIGLPLLIYYAALALLLWIVTAVVLGCSKKVALKQKV